MLDNLMNCKRCGTEDNVNLRKWRNTHVVICNKCYTETNVEVSSPIKPKVSPDYLKLAKESEQRILAKYGGL